jgi:DNA-binding Xre family transcriptional regulator
MAKRAFAGTRGARFIERRILELQSRKNQATMAAEAGFRQPNVLSMIKTGAAKIPLERVPALAKALECDPASLFVMAVEQQDNALAGTLEEIYGTHVTQNEIAWLKAIREASDHCDPTLTTRALKAIRGVFGK